MVFSRTTEKTGSYYMFQNMRMARATYESVKKDYPEAKLVCWGDSQFIVVDKKSKKALASALTEIKEQKIKDMMQLTLLIQGLG